MAGSVAVYVVAVLAAMAFNFGFGSGDFGGVALRINAILSDGVADWAAVAIADALAAFAVIMVPLALTLLGVYLTGLAIKGNGLEYAVGFHAGLNVFAISIITLSAASMPAPTIFFDRAPNFPLGVAGRAVYCALHYRIVFALAPPRQS